MILIGLGSNLDGIYGSPHEALQECNNLFSFAGIKILKFSSIWKSAPVPISDQPWYMNAVCSIQTELNPHNLLSVLAKMEDKAGRIRRVENEARTLDLDILSYNSNIIDDNILQIPHPELHKRAFVLYPLHEIAPSWIHPVFNDSVEELTNQLPKGQEIEKT